MILKRRLGKVIVIFSMCKVESLDGGCFSVHSRTLAFVYREYDRLLERHALLSVHVVGVGAPEAVGNIEVQFFSDTVALCNYECVNPEFD